MQLGEADRALLCVGRGRCASAHLSTQLAAGDMAQTRGNRRAAKTSGSLNRTSSLYQFWEFCLASLRNRAEYEIPQENQEKLY